MQLLIVLGRREPALSGVKTFFKKIAESFAKGIERIAASVKKPSGSDNTR